MSVNSTNKQYDANLKLWQKVRDCVEGSNAVKSRSAGSSAASPSSLYGMAGARYLPPPNPDDQSSENKSRFMAYRDRANYVNFTGATSEGMLGMVFRKKMDIRLPTAIEYLEDNATGGGLSMDQLAQSLTKNLLETGRMGILTEYPEATDGLTVRDVNDLGLAANLIPYTAENIINWRTTKIGSSNVLSLVVLQEEIEEVEADGFASECKKQYRVLTLEDGLYVVRLFDDSGFNITNNLTVDGARLDFILPRRFDGSYWSEIPFTFIGAVNNDAVVDKSPLYDIAEVNLSHYRNSADFEESSFLVGQPTPVLSGLTQSWVDENMSDGVHIGSRAAILLPDGGSGSLLQANENQMPSKGMELKEKQLTMIGARLIQDAGGQETVDAAKMRYAGQNSKLGTIAANVDDGLETACGFALKYMANPTDADIEAIEVDTNKEFYEAKLDPQEVMADIQLLDRGIVAKSDIQDKLRRAGKVLRDNEEIDADAESASPLETVSDRVMDRTINEMSNLA